MGFTKAQLLARLQELQVDYASYVHSVVLTVEAQAKYIGHLGGGLSKNLFLKDKKQRFYVVSALSGTNIDLKGALSSYNCLNTVMSQWLGLGKGELRMAPEEALQEILQKLGREEILVGRVTAEWFKEDNLPMLCCEVGDAGKTDPLHKENPRRLVA